MQTLIASYDHETGGIKGIATITPCTRFKITEKRRVSSYSGKRYVLGVNLYATLDSGDVLLETYETKKEARTIKALILRNMVAGAEAVII